MKTYTIKGIREDGKESAIAYCKFLTDYPITVNREDFLNTLIKNISDSKEIGYAGFLTKQDLKEGVRSNIFDSEKDPLPTPFQIAEKEYLSVIKKAIQLCQKHVTAPPTHIFVFPTFSNFVKEKMEGATGYTPYQNTLLIFLSPEKTKHWKRALTETICHEFMHAVMNNYSERTTLLDDLVFEGVAESFVGALFGTKANTPSQALSQKKAGDWYKKLTKYLKNTDLYYPVFLEGKKYPLWTGYAIGYCIVEAFRKKYPEATWNDIVRIIPQAIHLRSGFGT